MKIVYFSRTGTCKKIAETLAQTVTARVVEITDGMNWRGIFGYIKAGYYSSVNKYLEVLTTEEVSTDETVIVIAPLWAGTIAQPAKEFIKLRKPENTALIIVSLGSTSKWPENKEDFLYVGDIVKNRNNKETVFGEVQKVLKELQK